MKKTIVVYSLAIAAAAFLLQWLEYQYVVRVFPTEVYVVVIAVLFTVLGVWVGNRLTGSAPKSEFERNRQAIDYLGVSDREVEVLELLAEGHSNQEIADSLFVSPNTVKTHLANLYGKLEVSRRTQAVQKAKQLRLIP
jgi:DNA-binding CsgD family transcriptional regulator